jgi:hypothetical protein
MVRRIVCLWAVILALLCCPGCRVFVQNRYAVFGFDGFQTEYAEEARAWSLALLVGVALVSAAVGATGIWLGPRLYHGWREGQAADDSQREADDVIRGAERGLEMRVVDAEPEKRTKP